MAQRSTPRSWENVLAGCCACRGGKISSYATSIAASLVGARRKEAIGAIAGLAIAFACVPNKVFADPLYYVEVQSNSEELLEAVRTKVSDAYIVTKPDGTQSIMAGIFANETNARQLVSALQALNVSPTSITAYDSDPTPSPSNVAAAGIPSAARSVSAGSPTDNTDNDNTDNKPIETNSSPTERQYSTLVTVPTDMQPATALKEIRHLFPHASLHAYEGQPAIQTGTFSHRSQAQLQAQWLANRDFVAISVPSDRLSPAGVVGSVAAAPASPPVKPTGPPNSIPPTIPPSAEANSPSAGTAPTFWVLVADPIGRQYSAIKAIVPDAEPTLYNQQQVVHTGAFESEEEAMEQVRFLSSKGYEAGIFTAIEDAFGVGRQQAAQQSLEEQS